MLEDLTIEMLGERVLNLKILIVKQSLLFLIIQLCTQVFFDLKNLFTIIHYRMQCPKQQYYKWSFTSQPRVQKANIIPNKGKNNS